METTEGIGSLRDWDTVRFFVRNVLGNCDFEYAVLEASLDLLVGEPLRNGDDTAERTKGALGDPDATL